MELRYSDGLIACPTSEGCSDALLSDAASDGFVNPDGVMACPRSEGCCDTILSDAASDELVSLLMEPLVFEMKLDAM